MIHQLLIKLFIVIFVINITLIWLIQWNEFRGYLWLLNLVFLIALLFQHRDAIKKNTPPWKRTLFTPSVFFLISIWFWLFCFQMITPWFWQSLHINPFIWSIWLWLLMYVASYIVFRMDDQETGWKWISRFFLWLLLLWCLWWVGTLLWSVSWLWILTSIFDRSDAQAEQAIKESLKMVEEELSQWSPLDKTVVELIDWVERNEGEEEKIEEIKEIGDAPTIMTYAYLLPKIQSTANLWDPQGSYTFTNIANNSQLYSSFARARDLWMVWTDISPTWQVKCKNLMVIRGLAEWWNVENNLWIFDAYWNYAKNAWVLNSCNSPEQTATTNYFEVTP